MDSRAPVERSYVVRGAAPREVYDVVVDFEAYPRLFPELTAVRVLERTPVSSSAPASPSLSGPASPSLLRVEFRASVVIPVRYVLNVRCDPEALTVDWTYVEGEIVVDSVGGWRFQPDAGGIGTKVDYRAAMQIKAPLPGFIVRKATDALVSASLPGMFAAIDREVHRRKRAAAAP